MMKQVDVTEYAKQHGFILPVKIDPKVWQSCIGKGLKKIEINDCELDDLDSLLKSCSDCIKHKHNSSKTDIEFKYVNRNKYKALTSMILKSQLEFDRKKRPYLLIRSH